MVTLSGPAGSPYRLAPSKIIALGLNYLDHIAESQSVKVQGFGRETPKEPVLFPKTPNVLIGHGEPILIPAFLEDYRFEEPRVDYEAELAFVSATAAVRSRRGGLGAHPGLHLLQRREPEEPAANRCLRLVAGKSLDTFGPVGPRLVAREELGDPQDLGIRCRLNGRVVQESRTRNMIFPIPRILAFISRNFTLEEGT